MNEITGDFWELAPAYQVICCPCNSTLQKDGRLVMGKGIAAGFAGYYPNLPVEWGTRIALYRAAWDETPELFFTPVESGRFLCYFQTKRELPLSPYHVHREGLMDLKQTGQLWCPLGCGLQPLVLIGKIELLVCQVCGRHGSLSEREKQLLASRFGATPDNPAEPPPNAQIGP